MKQKLLNLKENLLKIAVKIDNFISVDDILKTTLYLVVFFSMVLFLTMLTSCNTTKKALSRSTNTARLTEDFKSDSSYFNKADSVHVKTDSAISSLKKDSSFDSRVTIEEEIEYNNAQVSKVKRKTTFEDKGRYVFESLEKQVSEDSINQRKEVRAIKSQLIAKDSSTNVSVYTKDVERKRLSWFVYLIFILIGVAIGYYIASALPGWSKWAIAIVKKIKL